MPDFVNLSHSAATQKFFDDIGIKGFTRPQTIHKFGSGTATPPSAPETGDTAGFNGSAPVDAGGFISLFLLLSAIYKTPHHTKGFDTVIDYSRIPFYLECTTMKVNPKPDP